MRVEIRSATDKDMLTVAEINIICVPNGTRAKWGAALTAEFFRYFLEEDKLFWVAEVEDKIVGYVMGYFKGSNVRFNFENNYIPKDISRKKNDAANLSKDIESAYNAVLYSLCVLPDYSKHGIGKKLAAQFSEYVITVTGSSFCLSTGINNYAAQRIYERTGMQKICDSDGLRWYAKGVENMELTHKKILILAPHTDDGELGCGGTIAKFIENGNTVYHAVFSVCEQSVPGGLSQDTLEREFLAASEVLGVTKNYIFRYPVRRFNEFRQAILEDLLQIRNEINPHVVIMPGLNDIHQDHHVLAEEGLRAFKQSTLMCYEMVWNNLKITTTTFVKLEQRHMDKKIQALQAYHSQWGMRNYFNKDFIESLATVRGIQVNTKYAEAFDVLRWIL